MFTKGIIPSLAGALRAWLVASLIVGTTLITPPTARRLPNPPTMVSIQGRMAMSTRWRCRRTARS
jgi:hypothetical protein